MATNYVEVLVIVPLPTEALDRIAAVDPRIRVVDARGWFDSEIAETWPRWTVERYLAQLSRPEHSRAELDGVLAIPEVILGGWPFPLDLRARAQRLRWFHQLPAGASNLMRGDLWKSDVIVTTSRGYGNIRAMAEYTVASFLLFARGLDHAFVDREQHRFNHTAYKPLLAQDKTVCVVGAGGIGQEVGRLSAALGMRVIGTKRAAAGPRPEGFSEMGTPNQLHKFLARSDFVAICCQWTPETTRLIGHEALAAMKPSAVLVNVARGEIIDEDALNAALEQGKLRGVALDVYVGEFERSPDARLWNHERVIITPHVSAGSDLSQHRGVELFCANLRAYLDDRPLTNVIDWDRGY
ncbi:MAG TPA: D-2-hydroxyacid dehydrogenase [Candidatus Binataceae bacterium]|nr:D-2-hydroxyacid dehydrogenase [Candidatus Binataceae bacterium]